jgi:hypothetical protein
MLVHNTGASSKSSLKFKGVKSQDQSFWKFNYKWKFNCKFGLRIVNSIFEFSIQIIIETSDEVSRHNWKIVSPKEWYFWVIQT